MSKSKYINRDELVKYLRCAAYANPIAIGVRDDICDVIEQYEGADANVRENIKAVWVKVGQSFINPNSFRNYECSNCRFDANRIKHNFCPNCGAIMDGGGQE